MDIRVARTPNDIPFSAADWNELVESGRQYSVFQTYEWFECWWDVFGNDKYLEIMGFFDGSTLVGFAPLMRSPGLRGYHRLSFVGDTHADYIDLVSRPGWNAKIISALLDALLEERNWSVFTVRNLPAASPTYALLNQVCSVVGLPMQHDSDVSCPSMWVRGRETEVAALVKKYSLRRAVNYFQRQGHFEIRNIETVKEAQHYLPVFFDQHIRRWKETSHSSLFLLPKNQEFYTRLVERLLPSGRLLFSVAELDGQSISFHFGFDYRGSVIWYKPSFEPHLARHSPGTVQVKHLMDYVLSHRRKELDFTIGAEPFKQRYANMTHKNHNLRIFCRHRDYFLARSVRTATTVLRRFYPGAGEL